MPPTAETSGIHIRSIELPDIKFAMKGYQIYEEPRRGVLGVT
jgi:hypothetical protein